MEYACTKPVKPSSNISEMVSKFAKVCKLRSIGVFNNDDPNRQCHWNNNAREPSIGESSCDATEEMECDGDKVHPQLVVMSAKSDKCGENDILELFDMVSALKLAYIQLQEAHVPYDPNEIVAADEIIVAKLEAMCKIKRSYKEKQFIKAKLDSSLLDCLRVEIEVNEKLLEKLKSQNRVKDAEIMRLRQELCDLDSENGILTEKIRQIRLERRNASILNLAAFEDIFKRASKSVHDFAKPIISLMKASGWNLDMAVNSIENDVVFSKMLHKKYAFEAYIARRMFHGISLESHNVQDIMRFDDPIDSLIENPNSEFSKFCTKKYLLVVHPVMEMSFFGNLDQRMFLLSGKHPRTAFYQIFAKMAKWIWVLEGIATSIDPNAEIFFVKRRTKFCGMYMESIEEHREGALAINGSDSDCKVEFMVMPGFRIGDTVVRSQVYLSK